MRLSKPMDRRDPLKSLKAWARRLGDDREGVKTLQYELVDALLCLRYQANKDGWLNWNDNYADMIDLLLAYLPGGPREEGIRRDLEAIREAGQGGADEGRMAYEEIDRLLFDLMAWCAEHRDWIELPEGYIFWSDVPPDSVSTSRPSLFQRLRSRFTSR